jgi:protein SCO1/2
VTAHRVAGAEAEVEAAVDAARRDPSQRVGLVDLLHEGSGLYRGRGSAASGRMRGWVMASFEDIGLPDEARPYVLEDLHNDFDPYTVAAAAKAARGALEPSADLAIALIQALTNVRGGDDSVTFDAIRPTWPAKRRTTPLIEILKSLQIHGAADPSAGDALDRVAGDHARFWSADVRKILSKTRAALRASAAEAPQPSEHLASEASEGPTESCCGSSTAQAAAEESGRTEIDGLGVEVEDQSGARGRLDDFLRERPTVLAFFYTRCPNPNKCSLTVSKLAALQQLVASAGAADDINIAAITYDPGFDLPPRLSAYGDARGLRFGRRVRMLRIVRGHDKLMSQLAVRVGYSGSIVNRHGIELFLLGTDLCVERTWSHLPWDVDDVATTALAHSEAHT